MTENELFALVRTNLKAMMLDNGAPADLAVVRDYAVSQQGRVETPVIYMNRQALRQYGSPEDSYRDILAPGSGEVVRTNKQTIELQLQFTAGVVYNPADGLRPGDLLNLASRVMGTPAWLQIMRAAGVSMYRIESAQQTYRVNDRTQYEPVPVLLATFIYDEEIITRAPVVTNTRTTIQGV